MKYFLILLVLSFCQSSTMEKIYVFSPKTNIREWRNVDDGVMGGISKSNIKLTEAGHGEFSGSVSLANNGGFGSIQMYKSIKRPTEKKFIVLRVKGDGKRYEFRLKGGIYQSHSYVHQFATSGEWETIKLEISEFYPQLRGRRLNIPNFNFETIEQISFLIANSREEDFKLLIDWIGLE